MQELQNLEMSVLMDMLARHTEDYMKLLTKGSSEEEFNSCKTTVTLIQSEIESRNQTHSNTISTDTNINFKSGITE